MKDLKDHVLISEDTAHTIITILRLVTCDNENELVSETIVSLEKALTQDLGGTMNVPIELTEAMMERALEVLGRMQGFELKLVAITFYKAMLSAAQKEKNNE